MANTQFKLAKKRKNEVEIGNHNFEEKEVEIVLKIFVQLVIKDPEEIENDKTDGAALDVIILAVSKLRELVKEDIDSLKLPHALKVSIKLLKTFIDFLNQSKILKTLKDASSKKHSSKKRKAIEGSLSSVESDQ